MTNETKIIPFSRFRADVAKSGSQRLKEILGSNDVMGVVETLDPLEIFSLAQDVGEADVMDIVALASADQVKRIIDLGIGSGDAPDLRYVDRWLNAAIDHGHGSATRLFEKLDEDLQTLYLFRRLHVYDARDDAIPDDDIERLVTPDGTFIVEVLEEKIDTEIDESLPQAANEEATEKPFSPLRLIADLYYVDWQRADTMMRDAKWAIAAEHEATITRLRDARLEELGFPPRESAAKLFSRRGAASALANREGHTASRATLPLSYAEPFFADSFFVNVLNKLTREDLLGEIENELVFAVNATCVFEERVYSDPESVKAAGRDVRNWISLGLETASLGNLEVAETLVQKHPLRELLSLGVEQSHKLADWLRKAEAEGLFRLPGLKRRPLSSDDERFLRALLGRLPRYADAGQPARAFGSRRDLAVAQKRIETIAKQVLGLRTIARAVSDFSEALVGCEPEASAVTLELLLRSALLRTAIGASLKDTFSVSPADLRAFHALALTQPAAPDPMVNEAWTALVQDVLAAGPDAEPEFLALVTRKENA